MGFIHLASPFPARGLRFPHRRTPNTPRFETTAPAHLRGLHVEAGNEGMTLGPRSGSPGFPRARWQRARDPVGRRRCLTAVWPPLPAAVRRRRAPEALQGDKVAINIRFLNAVSKIRSKIPPSRIPILPALPLTFGLRPKLLGRSAFGDPLLFLELQSSSSQGSVSIRLSSNPPA